MATLWRHKFAILAGLGILVMCLMPPSQLPKTQMQNADKLVHFAFYFFFGLAITLDQFLAKRTIAATSKQMILRALFLILFGVGVELIQLLTPYRSSSLYDIFANLLGVAAYVIIVWIIALKIKK